MPFVFLVAAAAATVYFLRLRRQETAPSTSGGSWLAPQVRPALVGISGWLLVYVVGLAIELAHGLALTIGSVVIYSKPSLAGLHSFIPLWALLIYVISNLGLVAYGVTLFVLMYRERKAAITHNIVFNALSIAFLLVWFSLSEKSPFGTIVDSLPGVLAIGYFVRSRRVRNTFATTSSPLSGT
jgi:hypothetical protein